MSKECKERTDPKSRADLTTGEVALVEGQERRIEG